MYRKGKKIEFYTELAKKQNYPARSVYKLKEIDEKYKIFEKGDRVLDLGCAPGSWLLYIAEKIGNTGTVVGADVEEIKIPPKNNIKFIKKSVFDFKEGDFKDKFNPSPLAKGEGFDAVVSDMAPNTTGVIFVDSGKSLELSKKAFEIAKLLLKPGGNFVCKIFDSREATEFFKKLGKSFAFSKRFKPKAVIGRSKEFYIVGKGFKGF
ncbi:MAG: RlmE family RNA methyltransferase [bacterium]